MATTSNAAFMGKNFSTLTLKQMFDVTAQLVNDQEEINEWPGQNSVGKNVKIHGNELQEKMHQGNLVKKQIYSKVLIITTMSNHGKLLFNWLFKIG